LPPDSRQTGSNPFPPSRGTLAARLKPTQKLAEAEWVQELKHIENEVTHVVDVFNFLEEIIRLGNESEAAQDAFNATPLFWNVHRDCLQESMFIGLGRLCDPSPDTINVNRVLTTAMVHPEFFSEQALRRGLKERNLSKEQADNLIADAWMPKDRAEFKYLKKTVSFHLSRIEQIYRPIRNSHYGHRLRQGDIQAMFARTNRRELGETLDAA
jgi:AbiU2